jgi:hypothetical protein
LAVTDAGTCDADGKMRLAGSGAADQHEIALLVQKVSAGEVSHQRLVDRRVLELELVDLLGVNPGARLAS